ncbi:MAG: Adenine-specific methyltransferase [Acidimicrobiaceae bacterium]|nr:Adenine-specific methyltransferase [Acidimicrobiaceae bacterium]
MTVSWEIREGDCIEVMQAMPESSIDSVVCDPPYGLEFMGKDWDSFGRDTGNGANRSSAEGRGINSFQAGRPFQAWTETWAREALRVLKPGGHLIAFGGTRTHHRLAVGVEDAGFEIRDSLIWLYGSGFPKSLNLDGAHEGWGTALKPGHEPVVVARRPLEGTVAANVLEHGTGALNIDGCRIAHATVNGGNLAENPHLRESIKNTGSTFGADGELVQNATGRWPANIVLSHTEDCVCVGERRVPTGTAVASMETVETWDCAPGCPVAALDEQSGESRSSGGRIGQKPETGSIYGGGKGLGYDGYTAGDPGFGDTGGASRFFYCAKASRAERNAGLNDFEKRPLLWSDGEQSPGTFQSDGTDRSAQNFHPTVKPIELMRWLVRLVTPPNGIVMDPFTGSGTTGCAAVLEGFDFIGIERDKDYPAIARARIAFWAKHPDGLPIDKALTAERTRRAQSDSGQLSLEAA